MSMLQQILDQMFVDPEILDALDEEQKQILFIKMREEQVKRWKAFEEKCEKEPVQGKKKKDESRRIKWLHGGDGEVWVWVMGEHKDDLSLEELIEKRDMEEARKIAEEEILTELKDNSSACLYPVEDETTLKQQLSRMGMGSMHVNMNMNNVLTPSVTNDNNSKQRAAAAAAAAAAVAVAVDAGSVPVMDETTRSDQNFNVSHQDSNNISKLQRTSVASTPNVQLSIFGENYQNEALLLGNDNSNNDNLNLNLNSNTNNSSTATTDNSTTNFTDTLKFAHQQQAQIAPTSVPAVVSVPLPPTTASLYTTAATLSSSSSYPYPYSTNNAQQVKPGLSGISVSVTPSSTSSPVATTTTLLPSSSTSIIGNSNANINNNNNNQPQHYPSQSQQQKPSSKSFAITQQQYHSSTLPAKIDFTSTKTTIMPTRNDYIDSNQNILSASVEGANVRMRSTAGTRPSLTDDDISKRQSEIFERMKEKHKKNNKEAEIEAERGKIAWEEQERKAREAEAQIRQIAQKAREQHRQQSLRTSTSILPALNDTKASSLREAIKNLPRPPKPKSRQAIVDWFRVVELKRGTGLDPKTRLPARWFHGIISRDQAEALLKGRPTGSFLVRVSDRIWGYTVSYVVDEGTSKHFLIERIPQGYQFLGTNQVVHEQLYDLITYHETAPITVRGNEILKWPIGQNCSPPDYADLMTQISSAADGRITTPSSSSQRQHYQQQQHFSTMPMNNTNTNGNNVTNKMYSWVGN